MRAATIREHLGVGVDIIRYVPASKDNRAWPPLLDEKKPHNIGDWFVTKVTDRLLDYDELIVTNLNASDREWDYINRECDVLILKGGNYIKERWLTENFGIGLFRKIKIPIVMFGVGLQASLQGKVAFEPEETEILRYIHDSCACSSVRGQSTADALHGIGIKNVIVTGCPTIFWSKKQKIKIRKPNDSSAGFTFRCLLFSDDQELYKKQFKAIDIVRDKFGSVEVFLQGEEVLLQHYHEWRNWGAQFKERFEPIPGTNLRRLNRKALDPQQLRQAIHERYGKTCRPGLIDWIMNNAFFSYDACEYIDRFKTKGMMVGCRLHGNLVALANECPAFYLTYDQRTQELVDLFDLPHRKLIDFDENVELLDQDWAPFERKYSYYYKEMLRFMEMNHLRHRMEAAAE